MNKIFKTVIGTTVATGASFLTALGILRAFEEISFKPEEDEGEETEEVEETEEDK